jgi:hypothetical protein
MACPTLENLFIDHAMLIRNDTVKSIQDTDFYIKNLPKEPWLDGNGYQYSYPIYERSLVTKAVTDADFFQDFATLDNTPDSNNNLPATGACSLPGHNIDSFGVTLKTVSLKKAAINSPDICLDDLKFQWQVMDQIKNVTRIMSENAKWVWSNTYQQEVLANYGNRITAGIDGVAAAFNPATPPTSMLTFGILEEIHQELGYAGGSINPSGRLEDGTPVYTAVGSNYTFNQLKKSDANNRNDFNFAAGGGGTENDIMIRQIGLGGRSYHGFKFATVQFPPRYDIDGGVYVRRYPYVSSNASRGKKWEVDTLYKNAEFEDTVIYHDDVFKILIPKPGGSLGGMSYQQQYSWAGEFVWRNIPDRECNIDGNTGFFRALFAYGVKVERPDLGFVVRHLRCNIDPEFAACAAS